jgi:fluoroacetyl-CoA thioesterase
MELEPGLEATVTATVTDDDTAAALGSGDVDVLGTPCVLALAEQAAVAAVRDSLPAGRTSVGTWAEVFHSAPTPVGAEVTVSARLTSVQGSRLEFTIVVGEGERQVARVEHRRAVVDRSRFG